MADELFTLTYDGGEAAHGRLDFYDASVSYEGFARVLAILGHYYVTGDIISQAPRSAIEIYLVPPEAGSFKQNIIAAVVGAVLSVPFVRFTEAAMDAWFPKNDPQMARMVTLLEEQNRMLSERGDDEAAVEKQRARDYVRSHQGEIDVMRSITSNSFLKVFRPIGRSAETVAITGGHDHHPIGVVTPRTLSLIQSEIRDDQQVTVVGVVSAFSRNSKTGVMFSKEMGRGFRFQFMGTERLAKEDIFSWSQFRQEPIAVQGEFVYFQDGTIKKFLAYYGQPAEGE